MPIDTDGWMIMDLFAGFIRLIYNILIALADLSRWVIHSILSLFGVNLRGAAARRFALVVAGIIAGYLLIGYSLFKGNTETGLTALYHPYAFWAAFFLLGTFILGAVLPDDKTPEDKSDQRSLNQAHKILSPLVPIVLIVLAITFALTRIDYFDRIERAAKTAQRCEDVYAARAAYEAEENTLKKIALIAAVKLAEEIAGDCPAK